MPENLGDVSRPEECFLLSENNYARILAKQWWESVARARLSVHQSHSAPNTNKIFIKGNTNTPKKSSVASLLPSTLLPGYALWAGHSSWTNSYLTYHFLMGLTQSHYCKGHLLALLPALHLLPQILALLWLMALPRQPWKKSQLLVLPHYGKVLFFHGHTWGGNDVTQRWHLSEDKVLLKGKPGCFRFLLCVSPASHLSGIYAWSLVTVDSPSLLCF